MTFFNLCKCWLDAVCHKSAKHTLKKQTNKYMKSRIFFHSSGEFWVPALVGSWFPVCFSALSRSEHFIFVRHAAGIRASFSLVLLPRGTRVHRDTEEETTCLWPVRREKRRNKNTPLFQNYLSIPLSSSSIPLHPQPTLRPPGFESLLFGHIPCWQSISLFFLPPAASCRRCLPRSWGSSSSASPRAAPPGTAEAVILLVTSDTAQLPPVDQAEGKWTWEEL